MAELTQKQADGYVIPLGPVNLVRVITDVGMVGCGALTYYQKTYWLDSCLRLL